MIKEISAALMLGALFALIGAFLEHRFDLIFNFLTK